MGAWSAPLTTPTSSARPAAPRLRTPVEEVRGTGSPFTPWRALYPPLEDPFDPRTPFDPRLTPTGFLLTLMVSLWGNTVLAPVGPLRGKTVLPGSPLAPCAPVQWVPSGDMALLPMGSLRETAYPTGPLG